MNATVETFGTTTETIWGEPLVKDTLAVSDDIVVTAEIAKMSTLPYEGSCPDCLFAVVAITTSRGRVKICTRHLAAAFHAALLRKRGNRTHAD